MITLVPVGGLANRMKAIDAAIALAHEVSTELHIIWYKDQGLNCRFDELFQAITVKGVTLKEASFMDLWIYDRPRKKNFFIPSFFQSFLFSDCIYEAEVTQRMFAGFDFIEWARQRRVYLASCVYFFSSPTKKLFDVFTPITSLQKEIEHNCASFSAKTIGIHIRRTDNITSINESPTELFIEQIEKELLLCSEANFYLASDSEEDKRVLRAHFGDKILSSSKAADRTSVRGMQEAMIEMYTLAQTKKIIGSAQSSYSETAAQLKGIECVILKK